MLPTRGSSIVCVRVCALLSLKVLSSKIGRLCSFFSEFPVSLVSIRALTCLLFTCMYTRSSKPVCSPYASEPVCSLSSTRCVGPNRLPAQACLPMALKLDPNTHFTHDPNTRFMLSRSLDWLLHSRPQWFRPISTHSHGK